VVFPQIVQVEFVDQALHRHTDLGMLIARVEPVRPVRRTPLAPETAESEQSRTSSCPCRSAHRWTTRRCGGVRWLSELYRP
jgi:hypothetical protein